MQRSPCEPFTSISPIPIPKDPPPNSLRLVAEPFPLEPHPCWHSLCRAQSCFPWFPISCCPVQWQRVADLAWSGGGQVAHWGGGQNMRSTYFAHISHIYCIFRCLAKGHISHFFLLYLAHIWMFCRSFSAAYLNISFAPIWAILYHVGALPSVLFGPFLVILGLSLVCVGKNHILEKNSYGLVCISKTPPESGISASANLPGGARLSHSPQLSRNDPKCLKMVRNEDG